MKKGLFLILGFLLGCSLFAQTDMGRYREIQVNNDFRIYILKSQHCEDFSAAYDFWLDNVFLWGPRFIINNQQDTKDYPDAAWKQASEGMFEWAWLNQHHFDNGVAYLFRTVNNFDNEWRLISQRVIYYSPDGDTVWYYYSIASLWEPY